MRRDVYTFESDYHRMQHLSCCYIALVAYQIQVHNSRRGMPLSVRISVVCGVAHVCKNEQDHSAISLVAARTPTHFSERHEHRAILTVRD